MTVPDPIPAGLHLTGTADHPDLLLLPWQLPLERWPADLVVALPRGISRHEVRFVRAGASVYAVKEIEARPAEREYGLLFELGRVGAPAVEPVAVVLGRADEAGEPLPAALVTRHLRFSLPYRALFSSTLREETAEKLLRALAVLLVRLHLLGFSWNDCSLSNALFRRDAGAFAAYLVDAETGELHDRLSDGQREADLEVARLNVAGELLDLGAGELLHGSIDPVGFSEALLMQYRQLWQQITAPIEVRAGERYLFDARIRRLNDLGFDVAELRVERGEGRSTVRVSPKVVDAGHHSRRLLRLTGIDAEENQARRLLNDMDSWRARYHPDDEEELVAHHWVAGRFGAVVGAVPRDLRGRLDPAQVFHEVLEHRWFMSERAGHDVGLTPAIDDYLATVLAAKRDEVSLLDPAP